MSAEDHADLDELLTRRAATNHSLCREGLRARSIVEVPTPRVAAFTPEFVMREGGFVR